MVPVKEILFKGDESVVVLGLGTSGTGASGTEIGRVGSCETGSEGVAAVAWAA